MNTLKKIRQRMFNGETVITAQELNQLLDEQQAVSNPPNTMSNHTPKTSKIIDGVEAYPTKVFECECPHCEEVNALPDDIGLSGKCFTHECLHCFNTFTGRAL